MPKLPSLDDLAHFQKVMDKGSFAAAARELGLPKSTLSKSIARLETDLGVRLIERTTRSLRPTEIGRIVSAHSRDMVEAFQAARLAAAAVIEGPSGRLRVSCPQGLLENLVDEVILTFLQTYPKVEVELLVQGRPVDLITDNVDIALRARTQMEAGASFVTRRLGLSRGILVAAPALLRAAPDLRDLRDIAELPALVLPGEEGDWRMVDQTGAVSTVRVAPRLVTSNMETLRRAAVRGLGVAQLPEHFCAREIAAGELERILPDLTTHVGTIYAVYSRETARAPSLRAFIDHLVLEFQTLSGPA
ncbi:MAG: LysR family transcriptional regulator [Salipiger marinus]|uniref:LysR family transcriptional regulator n=1 Tax=Salipiger marinus TaxID=555512 RepID=UPI004058BB6A